MRRPLVAGLAACVVLGGAVVPAAAKGKPRKAVRFEAAGSITVGHPGDDAAGVNATRAEFLESCAVPSSQGTDGYVIELPPALTKVASNVTLTGTDAAGVHDVDMHFFDQSCTSTGALATELPDEFGLMPKGTSYVLVTAWSGVEVTFTFEAIGV